MRGRRGNIRGGGVSWFTARLMSGTLLVVVLAASGLSWTLTTPSAAADERAAPARANSASSAYYEDALMLADEGELKAAIIQLKNALIKDPDHLAARILLGETYTRLGQAKAAVEAFETAVILGADSNLVVVPLFTAHLLSREYQLILETLELNARPRVLRGDLLIIRGHAGLELGNYIDAESDFNEAASLLPGRGAPLIGKALVFFNRGDYRRAERLVDRSIELSPNEAAGWYIKGEIKRARDYVPGAIESYSRALERDAFHYKARLARAGLLIDTGRLGEAALDLDVLDESQPRDPQVAYFRALILIKRGEWQDADAALNQALAYVERLGVDSKNSHPQFTLLAGVVRLLKGDQEQAWRLISDYVDAVPDDPSGRMILGRILLMRDEPATALSVLAPVLRLDLDTPEVYALMGAAQMRLGNFAEAAESLDQAISLADETVPLHMEVVRLKIGEGDEDGARERLSRILKMAPGSIEAYYLLAYLEIKRGSYRSARKYAAEMIAASPTNPTGYNLDGITLLGQGQIAEARAAFEAARALSPTFFSANHNLAQLDLAKGDLVSARARYEFLLQRNARDLRSMVELVKISKYEGKWDEAIQHLERVRSLKPGAWGFWMELSDLYLRKGDGDRALGVVEQLGRLAPDDVGVLVALGRADLMAERRDDARRTFARAAVYAKEDPEALRRIAKYMVLAGGFEDAESTLKAGLELEPDHRETHVSLIAFYANQDRFSEAFEHARGVKTRWPESSLGSMLEGDIHLRKRQWREALRAYEDGARREMTSPLALKLYQSSMAIVADEEGRRTAMKRLADYAGQHPGKRAVERTLAEAMSRNGDLEDAKDLLEKLMAQDPEDVSVLNNLAVLYTTMENPRAAELARRAYALRPEEAAVLDTLGWALVASGEPREALVYLREASARESWHPEIHYHLAVALKDLQRPGEALREVRLALKSQDWFQGREDALAMMNALSD